MGGLSVAFRRSSFAKRRRTVGFSQESLAETVGVDRSTVVRWEAGDTEPQPWLRPKIARVLQINLDELDALLSDMVPSENPQDDRLTYALEGPSRIDLVAIAELRQQLHALDAEYDRSPSTSLLGTAGTCHAQIRFLCSNAPNARVRRELYGLEAESATFMGQLVWDVSQRKDHVSSLGYLNEAIYAARQIKDSAAESYATLRKSYIALYGQRNPRIGLVLASRAADIGKGASPALTGLSLLHVAEANAMLRERHGCEQALGEAENKLTRIDDSDVAGEYFSLSELHRMSGSCYLFLKLPKQAESILRSASKALADKKKSQAIVLGNLSLAYIRQRELDEGTSTLHRTIDAVEITRGGGGLTIAFAAGRELSPWRHEPLVHELNDRLLTLMTAV
jgi:DNA-binding XRE family transcriptional regulator